MPPHIAARAYGKGVCLQRCAPLVFWIRRHWSVDVWFPRKVSGLLRAGRSAVRQDSRMASATRARMLDTPVAAQYKANEKRLPRELGPEQDRAKGLADSTGGRAISCAPSPCRTMM